MKTLPISLKIEDFNRIMKNTRKPKHRVAFILGFGSGMRISEIVSLRREDVDMERKRILIRRGKGGRDRIVPLPKHFSERSLNHIPLSISPRALQYAFKNRIRKLGLNPRLHFHSLRHGFATRLIEKGVPLNQVQLLLGHSNVATTSIYIRASPDDALKSYEENF